MPIVSQTTYKIVQPGNKTPLSNNIIQTHCIVLQHLIQNSNPNDFDPNIICEPIHTKVGWKKQDDGSVDGIIQIKINQLFLDNEWVSANFHNQEHKSFIKIIDISPFIVIKEKETRELLTNPYKKEIYMKIIAETFPNMNNQNRIFKIPFKSVNNIMTKGSIDTYCSVLQHFVRANPPVCNGFIINPMKTKIGYRFKTDDSIDLIIQIEVNKIDINILEDASQWVTANFDLPEHDELSKQINLTSWLSIQDNLTKEWIRKAAQSKSANATQT